MATVKELRAKAKSLFFKGYSKMNKAELEKLISDYEASEEAFRDMDPLTHSQQSTTTTQQEQQVTFGVTFEIGADDDNIPVSQEPPIRDDDVLIPEVEVAAETNADLLALMELEEMFDIARIVNYTDCKEVARELYYECDCSLDGVRKRIIRRLSCKIGTFELVKNAPSMSFDDYMKVVNVKGTDYLRFDLAEITGKDYSHFEHFSREKCVKDMIAYYHKVAPLALSEHASLHEQAQPEIHEATQADPEQPQQEPATVEETQSSPATTTENPEHASNPAPSTQYNTEKTTHINSTQELFNICIERNGLDNVVIYFDEKHSLKIRDIQDITRKVFSWCDCSYPRKWSHFANPYQSLIDEIATFIGVDEPDASKRNNTVCTWLRDKKEEYEVTGKKPVMLKDELRPSQDNGRKLGTFTFTFTKNKQKQSMNFTVSIFEFEDRPLYRKIFGKVLQLTDTEGKIAARFSPYSDSLQLAFDFRYALKGKKTIASLEKQFRAVVQSFLTKAKLLDKQGHLIPDGNEDIRALWEEYYDSHYKPIWERNAPSAPQQEPETVQEVTSEVTPELVDPPALEPIGTESTDNAAVQEVKPEIATPAPQPESVVEHDTTETPSIEATPATEPTKIYKFVVGNVYGEDRTSATYIILDRKGDWITYRHLNHNEKPRRRKIKLHTYGTRDGGKFISEELNNKTEYGGWIICAYLQQAKTEAWQEHSCDHCKPETHSWSSEHFYRGMSLIFDCEENPDYRYKSLTAYLLDTYTLTELWKLARYFALNVPEIELNSKNRTLQKSIQISYLLADMLLEMDHVFTATYLVANPPELPNELKGKLPKFRQEMYDRNVHKQPEQPATVEESSPTTQPATVKQAPKVKASAPKPKPRKTRRKYDDTRTLSLGFDEDSPAEISSQVATSKPVSNTQKSTAGNQSSSKSSTTKRRRNTRRKYDESQQVLICFEPEIFSGNLDQEQAA